MNCWMFFRLLNLRNYNCGWAAVLNQLARRTNTDRQTRPATRTRNLRHEKKSTYGVRAELALNPRRCKTREKIGSTEFINRETRGRTHNNHHRSQKCCRLPKGGGGKKSDNYRIVWWSGAHGEINARSHHDLLLSASGTSWPSRASCTSKPSSAISRLSRVLVAPCSISSPMPTIRAWWIDR